MLNKRSTIEVPQMLAAILRIAEHSSEKLGDVSIWIFNRVLSSSLLTGFRTCVCIIGNKHCTLCRFRRRYSQTEKEALALGLVWTCERFNLYQPGLTTFDLVTDREGLKVTYSIGSRASAPIERCVLRLQPYNYKVCCVKSQDNIADALSRLTKIPASEKYRYDDEHVRMAALIAVSIALRIHEIESASAGDEDLQAVQSCLGNWEKAPKPHAMSA